MKTLSITSLLILCFQFTQCQVSEVDPDVDIYPLQEIMAVSVSGNTIAFIGHNEEGNKAYLFERPSTSALEPKYLGKNLIFSATKSGSYEGGYFKNIYQGDNSIYEMTEVRGGICLNQFEYNSRSKNYDYKINFLSKEFELESDGNIETYSIISCVIGNGVCAFTATTLFSPKTFLFTYSFSNNKVKKIDLSLIAPGFTKGQQGGLGAYVGKLGNENVQAIWDVAQVFTGINTIVLLKINNTLLPVVIDGNGNTTIKWDNLISRGKDYEEGGLVKFAGNTFYLPISSGYFNFYSNGAKLFNLSKNNPYTVSLYSNEFNRKWQTEVSDFTVIKYVCEIDNFIVIGGYTTESGYLSFANAKIIVIDKKTKSQTYAQIIKGKNSYVSNITRKMDGRVVISISSTSKEQENRSLKFIEDELNLQGEFKNNLFQNK